MAKTTFHDHLILNRYLLRLFGMRNLEDLKNKPQLDDENLIGLADDGQSKFLYALLSPRVPNLISEDDLRRYDLNIVRHWQRITERRNRQSGHTLEMKYFQYLSLLFTEIYLDQYFNHKAPLQAALQREFADYQKELGNDAAVSAPHTLDDLRKLAFWNATGSGKTLLMHVNILQYQHYHGGELDNMILITPNAGLSRQHWLEFAESGIDAALFDKNSGKLFKGVVQIIEITKLGDKGGDTTVAAESFSGDNLVLVDEGHRGLSSGKSEGKLDGAWLKRRNQIIGRGFAFEYSATFRQSVGAPSSKKKKNEIFDTYARAVLFDYSYKYFYNDGYGKNSLILNLPKKTTNYAPQQYFTACLLSFYQQLYLYETGSGSLKAWNLEKPLWVFIGHTVKESKSKNNETQDQKTEKSDIAQVVHYLAHFLNHRAEAEGWLGEFLANRAQMLDDNDGDIFKNCFAPLAERFSGSLNALYADIVKRLFNSDVPQRLKLTHLKKADGELALSVGKEPFGVINIGDSAAFFKAMQDQKDKDFDTASDEFSGGLFGGINVSGSPINLLIGAKKFTEGWSSWRVSTMGLLNVGKSEGSQIIQMFGRGVRLKGRNMSLKRSLPEQRYGIHDLHLEKLETLNVFGIKADYMTEFKDYLHEEGMKTDQEMLTLNFPVQPNLPAVKLKTLALKDGYNGNQAKSFKRTMQPELYEVPKQFVGKIKKIEFVLDRYPRVQALASKQDDIRAEKFDREVHTINPHLLPWFDWDKIYRELAEYKHREGWYNLRLDKQRLKAFVEENTGWYTLFIPKSEMAVGGFDAVQKQQDLLLDLLKGYTKRFYETLKGAYEGQFYETREVQETDGSFFGYYQFQITDTADGAGKKQFDRLEQLRDIIVSGSLKDKLELINVWNGAGDIHAICFDAHLYYPLMVLNERFDEARFPVKMQPLVLQEESERRFIEDLQAAAQEGSLKTWTGGKDLYLLRNAANKSKGLGFALAGNFYPDFLLWLVCPESGRQWLSFADPKGIRQMDLDDPKFGLHNEVKQLEGSLKDGALSLSAFILSVTGYGDLINAPPREKLAEKNILFMDADKGYLKTMFAKILEETA